VTSPATPNAAAPVGGARAAQGGAVPPRGRLHLGLRGRISLAMVLVTLLPLAGAATLTTMIMGERFERDLLSRSAGLERALGQAYRRTGEELRASLEGLASHALVDEILLDLARGELQPDTERRALERVPGVMQAAGLDVLALVGPDGRVIAAGHLPGLSGRTLPPLPASGPPSLLATRLRRGEQTPELPSLQVAHAVARHGARVTLVGGRVLEQGFLQRLLPGADAQLRLSDASGEVLAAWPTDPLPEPSPPRRISLLGPKGGVAAWLELSVSQRPLHSLQRALAYTTGGAAGLGLVLALAFGAWLATRITRPVRALALGAAQVAAGDLNARVEAKGADELGALGDAFNRMIREVKDGQARALRAERLAAWADIARRLAHEIKNPLTPIRTSVETLRKLYDRQDPRFAEVFGRATGTVIEEVERLKRIVTEFSQFARMPSPRCEQRDLGEAVSAALGLFLGLAPGLSLEQDLQAGVRCSIDVDQVTQVVLNLVQNAAQVLGEGPGRILVRVEAAGGEARLWVADSGPGVPEAIGDRLFDPYVTARPGGTGLGLAVADRIASEHGGRLSLVERDDPARPADFAGGALPLEGACFCLRLPLV